MRRAHARYVLKQRRDRCRDVSAGLWSSRRRTEGDDLQHLIAIGHAEKVAERERGERAGKELRQPCAKEVKSGEERKACEFHVMKLTR